MNVVERKCMICGAELGEREKYCGNCGAKAPDGAVEQEEIEFKSITPNEQNPPHWNMTWNLQDFFCVGKGAFIKISLYGRLWAFILLQGIMFLRYADSYIFFGKYYHIMVWNNIITGMLFLSIGILSFVTRFKLINFQKDAPQYLYIQCSAVVAVWIMYVLIALAINNLDIVILVIAVIESFCCIIGLLIGIKYYKKRMTAFIN